jgi:SAM-dependent methyltransferase
MRVIAVGRDEEGPEVSFQEREIGDEDIEEEGAEGLAAALHAAAREAPRPDFAVDDTDSASGERAVADPKLDPAEGAAAREAPAPDLGTVGAEEEVEALDDEEVAVESDRPTRERSAEEGSAADRPAHDRPAPPKPPAKSAPPRIQARSQLPQPPATRRRPWWEHLFGDDFARAYRPLTESQVQKQVDFIEKSLGLAPGAVVLDLCCGQGQQAVELAARGYGVVGYDLSVFQLALAAENAQARQLKINFLQGDAREMAFDQMFDGLLCWDTSFGYFEEEKNHNVAERMFRALRPGGVLLLDMLNRDFAAVESPNHVWFEGDGCICMDDVSLDWITSRLRVKRSLILDDGRSRELTYSLRLYSLHELGKLLHDVGFRVTQASGDLTTPGVFMGPNSPRIIIRAQKPGA